MKHTEKNNYTCTWLKIKVRLSTKMKKELKRNNLSKNEISSYKQRIGYKLIDRNKLFAKEFLAWCDIFNSYKPKLELFNVHSKIYRSVFKEIRGILETIKKSLNIADKTFYPKMAEFIFKYTDNEEYKDILTLINSDYINNDITYDDMQFTSKGLEINELLIKVIGNFYFKDYDSIILLISEENMFFEKQITNITTIMDKLSDLCENKSILNQTALNNLRTYLEGHQNFIMKNLNEYN